jgi:hypothetical protein
MSWKDLPAEILIEVFELLIKGRKTDFYNRRISEEKKNL